VIEHFHPFHGTPQTVSSNIRFSEFQMKMLKKLHHGTIWCAAENTNPQKNLPSYTCDAILRKSSFQDHKDHIQIFFK